MRPLRALAGVALLLAAFLVLRAASAQPASDGGVSCGPTGAPPMRLVTPATLPLRACRGEVLTFDQQGATRYACLDRPRAAQDRRARPLVLYLHGSRTTPDTVYLFGAALVALQESFLLGDDPAAPGFALLSVEGRRAEPARSLTGEGFHWDEWHHDPRANLDALALDRFLEDAVARGGVDRRRVYVLGWSNGAYMAMLYGSWRADRVAGVAEFAGGDPWSRPPCPVPFRGARPVPVVLLRNTCDALVPYAETLAWGRTLEAAGFPLLALDLDAEGHASAPLAGPAPACTRLRGLANHLRWPDRDALEQTLAFWHQHPLRGP